MTDPNRRKGLTANVHRFRDHVAVSVGTGETVYLSPAQAEELGARLVMCAESLRTETSAQATFDPATIEIN